MDNSKNSKYKVAMEEAAKTSIPTSHYSEASRLEKVTKRVVAPYAKIERRSVKGDEFPKTESYLDLSRFTVVLEDGIDLNSLLYDTAMVYKDITRSSGVFVYRVNKQKNEIMLVTKNGIDPERHEVNIPISEGKILAAHVAATKNHLIIDDVQRDTRFSEGLKWIDAQVAMCVPIVKPNGECGGVIEFYRTFSEPYDNLTLFNVTSIAWWAGAAVYQLVSRQTIQKTSYLNSELLKLMKQYFGDKASLDTMITEMLSLIKSFMGAMRSSFFIIVENHIDECIRAEMWDDGWNNDGPFTTKKRVKVNLTEENTPAGYVARHGEKLNVTNVYKDPRFLHDVDPVSGTIVRNVLVSPIMDKKGVIGVVQLCNKIDKEPFDNEDEEIFDVFLSYCALIVHFNNIQQKKILHENFNLMYAELMSLHLRPCKHDFVELMETAMIYPPNNFRSYDYYIADDAKEEMPGLLYYMFTQLFDEQAFERHSLIDFLLTVISCYRDNQYHNSEHAYCFTHTMFLMLTTNSGHFDFVETLALMLGGLCHDLDHPGYNNNFLTLSKHPLSRMYKTSTLEYHHYFMAKKLIEDKNILCKISANDRARLLDEIKYNILCTDLAVYFQIRAQLSPIIANHNFDWAEHTHRSMLKAILMTTSDLSASCKPFGIAKKIAEQVYEEFYKQGDMEREMGYVPLSMMDRRRRTHQPAEQIQFLSVVVLPCLVLMQSVLPNVTTLIDNCTKTLESWHEEIEIRGQKLWKQDDSTTLLRSKFALKSNNESQ